VWQKAGLYDPDAPEAAERLALLEYLSERGATIEQMVEANEQHGLPGVAGDLARAEQPDLVSIQELAVRCGATAETVERVLLAAGLSVSADGEMPTYLDALITGFVRGVALMGEGPILAFTRVVGAAATNIAEAAVALFYTELGPGIEGEGRDELARAHIAERANQAFSAVPDALTRVLLAQFDRAAHRAVAVRGWSASVDQDEVVLEASETVALGFVDLVGSTAWAETLSLRDQSLALSRFESVAWSSAVTAGGRVVKMIGDAAFFAAPSVDAACTIAYEVCQAASEDPVLPPARAAVGYGAATSREGDYFGPLVNLVSRLVKVATPGTVVVTVEAAWVLAPEQWSQHDLGPQSLRGFDHRVRAIEISPTRPLA
jgi:adenylate cyclase